MYIKFSLNKIEYNDALSDSIFLIATFIVGIIFLFLGLLFAWLYNHLKGSQNAYEKKFIHKPPFSIIGFWGRNRMKIIIFMSGLFILIGFSLIVILTTGKMTAYSIM